MPIVLNHTIVPAHDKEASARFFARIFGLSYEGPMGHFAPVKVNETFTLDFDDGDTFDSHHYAFHVSDEEFDKLLTSNKFLEWARIHNGARYGTLIDEIIPAIENGKTVVREVDVQGFDSIAQHSLFSGPDATYHLQSIFILPESKEQLIERIKNRAPISDEELNHRIQSMEKEMGYATLCDVQIVNHENKLEEAIAEVEQAIT